MCSHKCNFKFFARSVVRLMASSLEFLQHYLPYFVVTCSVLQAERAIVSRIVKEEFDRVVQNWFRARTGLNVGLNAPSPLVSAWLCPHASYLCSFSDYLSTVVYNCFSCMHDLVRY